MHPDTQLSEWRSRQPCRTALQPCSLSPWGSCHTHACSISQAAALSCQACVRRSTAEQAAAGRWGFDQAVAHFRQGCGQHITQHWRPDRASAEAASTALDAANRSIAVLQPPWQPAAPLSALQQQLQSAAGFWAARDPVEDLLGLQRTQQPASVPPASASAGSKRQRGSVNSAPREPRPERQAAKRAKHVAGELSPKAQLLVAQLLQLVAAGHRSAGSVRSWAAATTAVNLAAS